MQETKSITLNHNQRKRGHVALVDLRRLVINGEAMRLLPAEQEAARARVPAIMEELRKEGKYSLSEPCNCGSHIRHNNGGNYHDIITFAFDNGQYFVMNDSTCELSEPAEWESIEEKYVAERISDYLAEGW